jgi:hypothetical protein
VQEVHRVDAVLAGDKGDPSRRVLRIEKAGAEGAQKRDIEGCGSSGGRFGRHLMPRQLASPSIFHHPTRTPASSSMKVKTCDDLIRRASGISQLADAV